MTDTAFLQQLLTLPEHGEIQRFLQNVQRAHIKKGTVLVEPGQVQAQLIILVSGVFRGFLLDAEGRDITDLPPYKRRVNTVFQKYALFPHLNVQDNIAFGLKIAKVPRDEIKKRVDAARARQRERLRDTGADCNAHMGPREMSAFCALSPACSALMENAYRKLGLSARSYDRILRVARTIADLEGAENIEPGHLAEAIQYRTWDFRSAD